MTAELIAEFEACIRRDPAQRGLIASEPLFGPLCPGHLASAAANLAECGRRVIIVTGFFIPGADPPAAETDGPPGALVLAQVLQTLGMQTSIVSDRFCFSALSKAAECSRYAAARLRLYPDFENSPAGLDRTGRWRSDLLQPESGAPVSHLIAIERVGPSHTAESLARQTRGSTAPFEHFDAAVPHEHRNHCHNMRGEIIDLYAGDVHRLFEEIATRCPSAKTIGIGDGANEIGMGSIPWEDLERRLTGEQAGHIPCRIATDWNIIAGTSNWGAYALAAAVALLRGNMAAVAPFDSRQQEEVVKYMVVHGPAVDGVTRRQEPTVDGLPFLTYLQPWQAIRSRLGVAE